MIDAILIVQQIEGMGASHAAYVKAKDIPFILGETDFKQAMTNECLVVALMSGFFYPAVR